MLNVAELIADPDFTKDGGIIRRRPTRTQVQGVTRTTHVDTTIPAVVQPASDYELKMLPEGSRLENVLAVYSLDEIQCTPQSQDLVVVDGILYRAVKSQPWSDQGYFLTLCEGYQP